MGKPIDLTNQVFEEWTVLERDYKTEQDIKNSKKYTTKFWLCCCSCGTIKSIPTSNLTRGKTKSCGCKRPTPPNFIDLTGRRFGRLVVIDRDESVKGTVFWNCECGCGGITGFKDLMNRVFYDLVVLYRDIEREKEERLLKGISKTYWVCKCVCNNLVSVEAYTLMTGNQKHCGCKRIDDLTDKTFGYLRVISRDIFKEEKMKKNNNTKNIRTYWKCECVCGSIKTIKGAHLVSGSIKSCGCIVSYGEKRIKEILNNTNITYKHNISIKEVKSSKGSVLKFDFIVYNGNKINYIIEFDGEQHFGYTGRDWSTKQHFEECRKNDLIKNKYCFDNNIILIRIPYTELKIMTLKDLKPITSSYILTPKNEKLYYSKYNGIKK